MNRALTSNRPWDDNFLPMNRQNYKILQLLLVEKGYDADRYSVLEPLCATDRIKIEKRKALWVQVYINALLANIDLDTIFDIRSCNFYENIDPETTGTIASLETDLTGANNDLRFESIGKGIDKNQISIEYVDPSGNDEVLSVTVNGYAIIVSLATGGAGAITSTANLILAAINASPEASSLVTVSLKDGNTGAGVVTAMAQTNLSGGSN